jgi:hypothetical protein
MFNASCDKVPNSGLLFQVTCIAYEQINIFYYLVGNAGSNMPLNACACSFPFATVVGIMHNIELIIPLTYEGTKCIDQCVTALSLQAHTSN